MHTHTQTHTHTDVCILRLTDQEGEEHADGGQEVPDIVSIIKVQQDARLIALAGLGWRQLNKGRTIHRNKTSSC